MSLQSDAVLFCAAGALRDVMPAWVKVEIDPADPLDGEKMGAQVHLALYGGDELHKTLARKWLGGDRIVELAVQVFLPHVDVVADGKPFRTRGLGARRLFTKVHRLMELAFNATTPGSWGELWQDFTLRQPVSIEVRPFLAPQAKGANILAREYAFACPTLSSPSFEAPQGAWAKLVAKMRADPAMRSEADGLEADIRQGDLDPNRNARARLGASPAEAAALGQRRADPVGEPPFPYPEA